MITQFFIIFKNYLIEILPFLMIGFFLSGLINEFIPTQWVEKNLSGGGIKPLLYSIFAGAALPICCWGSLPLAVTLRQKGAGLGPVLAFLVAAPATSISAILVYYALMGLNFTIFIFFSVIIMGLVMGLIGNHLIKFEPKTFVCQEVEIANDPICGMNVEIGKAAETEYKGENFYFCCSHCKETFLNEPEKYAEEIEPKRHLGERIKSTFRYAFVDMVKRIGPELLLGLVLAALVAAIVPVGRFIGQHFGGGFGYLFSLGFGLLMFTCATASAPLAHAFVFQGMNIGAGMVLLLVGPITNWGTILVLRKEFGGKTLAFYLATIAMMALALGYCFSII